MTSRQAEPADDVRHLRGIDRALGIYGHVPGLALWRAIELEMWDRAFESVTERPVSGPILDLACGPGLFTSQLQLPQKPVGLDLDAGVIRRAAASGVYSHVVVANACHIPFPDNFFSSAFSNSSLEHVRGVAGLFTEIHRVLEPDGVFTFIVPTDAFGKVLLRPRLLELIGLRGRGARAREATMDNTDTFNRLSRDEWCKLATDAGLEVASIESFMPRRAIWLWEVLHYGYTKPIAGLRIADLARKLGAVHRALATRILAPAVRSAARATDGVQIMAVVRKPAG